MSSKVSDKDVLQLFASLKNAESNYPQGMIESRRNTFAKQAAAMAILAKASGSGGVASTTATGQAASTASSSAAGIGGASMGTILETALIVAIVVEAGVATYAYREKIAQFIRSTFGPKVEQTANPPDNSSSDLITIEEETQETPEITPTGTMTETPVPPELVNPGSENNNGNNNNGDAQVASTPAPTDDNNGLHLGQTKQPTIEPDKKNEGNSNDKDKK